MASLFNSIHSFQFGMQGKPIPPNSKRLSYRTRILLSGLSLCSIGKQKFLVAHIVFINKCFIIIKRYSPFGMKRNHRNTSGQLMLNQHICLNCDVDEVLYTTRTTSVLPTSINTCLCLYVESRAIYASPRSSLSKMVAPGNQNIINDICLFSGRLFVQSRVCPQNRISNILAD